MYSLIIPAFNEEKGLDKTLENIRLIENILDLQLEVIFINDGSTDSTKEILENTNYKVINNPANLGYGRSLKIGILAASGEIIIISDADGTYPLSFVPQMIEKLNDGFDLVVAERTGEKLNPTFSKRVLRWILRFLVEYATGKQIPDINSGLRVFKKSTILEKIPTLCNTFSFTTSMTLAYELTGLLVTYIKVPYLDRGGSSKVKMFRDSLRTLQYIIEAIAFYNPIKLFLFITVVFVFLSFFCFTLTLLFHFLSTFLFGIGLLLCACIMFGLGIISSQIKSIFSGRI